MVLVLFLSVARKMPGKYIQRRQTALSKIPKYLSFTIALPPHRLSETDNNKLIYVFEYNFTLIKGVVQATSATWYGLDGPGIESRRGRDFSYPSRPALEPHSASYIMGYGSLSQG